MSNTPMEPTAATAVETRIAPAGDGSGGGSVQAISAPDGVSAVEAPAPPAPAPKAPRRAATRQRAAKAAPPAAAEAPVTPAAKAAVEAAASKARVTPKAASKVPRAAAAKGAATGTAKAAAKSAVKTPAKAFPQSAATKSEAKPAEVKRDKLVRDSFTMPKGEYAAIAELKQRGLGLAHPVKKSELLRAGLMLLRALDDQALLASLRQVPAIKTGRPARGEGKGAARKEKTGAH